MPAHAALRIWNWRLGRVYFLAFLNPSRGQPDPALTARLASPNSVGEPAIEFDWITAHAAMSCGSDIVGRSWQAILAGVRTGSVRRLSVLLGPRSHASHAVHRDVGDVSGWGVIHRREADLRTEVGVSKLLKELGSSSVGNARRAIDDEVLVEAHVVTRVGFDRERDAAVVADIAHFAVLGKMGRHDLVAVKTDPHPRHLGTAVGFKVTR
jgi:hypothetical protein